MQKAYENVCYKLFGGRLHYSEKSKQWCPPDGSFLKFKDLDQLDKWFNELPFAVSEEEYSILDCVAQRRRTIRAIQRESAI